MENKKDYLKEHRKKMRISIFSEWGYCDYCSRRLGGQRTLCWLCKKVLEQDKAEMKAKRKTKKS